MRPKPQYNQKNENIENVGRYAGPAIQGTT